MLMIRHHRLIDIQNLIRSLEHDCLLAIDWFDSNYMKLNRDKCHLMLAGYKNEQFFANVGNAQI